MSEMTLIDWIAQHQETLTWLGGGVTTAAGGAWVAVRYLLDRNDHEPASDKPADSRKATTGHASSTGIGISAARDVQIGGSVNIQQTHHVPKAAIALAALGLLLLGYAVLNNGGRVNVTNGSYVGGSVSNSQISVSPPKP